MNRQIAFIVLAVGLILAFFNNVFFTVYQTDKALVQRLGNFVTKGGGEIKVLEPGLHMRIPMLDQVLFFDSRINTAEVPSERIVTREKKDLIVDLFVQWRIQNFPLFYTRTKNVSADVLIRQKVVDVLRAEFGQRTIKNIVSGDRQEVLGKLKSRTEENLDGLGIKLIDIRIKRIDFPPDINDAVFDRMRSDRKRDATDLRSKGASEAEILRAEADKEVRVILAEADKEAEKIRGEGDASAAQTYADSYSQAPEFYDFYRSLEVYRKGFHDKQDVLILKPDSDFFKYFKHSRKE